MVTQTLADRVLVEARRRQDRGRVCVIAVGVSERVEHGIRVRPVTDIVKTQAGAERRRLRTRARGRSAQPRAAGAAASALGQVIAQVCGGLGVVFGRRQCNNSLSQLRIYR